jgi:hypothetical protein
MYCNGCGKAIAEDERSRAERKIAGVCSGLAQIGRRQSHNLIHRVFT